MGGGSRFSVSGPTAAFVVIFGVVELLSTTILIATYPMMSRAYTAEENGDLFGFIAGKLAFFTLLVSLPHDGSLIPDDIAARMVPQARRAPPARCPTRWR